MSGQKDSYFPRGLFNISGDKEPEMKTENDHLKHDAGNFGIFGQIFSKNTFESQKQTLDDEKEKKDKEINRLCVMYGC
uniref:Uncharacterized protein n=1 Tax=Strongyloides venezuelensis TaxID=75913 RepID=A0A0K0FQI9_STRVS